MAHMELINSELNWLIALELGWKVVTIEECIYLYSPNGIPCHIISKDDNYKNKFLPSLPNYVERPEHNYSLQKAIENRKWLWRMEKAEFLHMAAVNIQGAWVVSSGGFYAMSEQSAFHALCLAFMKAIKGKEELDKLYENVMG